MPKNGCPSVPAEESQGLVFYLQYELRLDGGNEYPRRLYNNPNSYQDLSEYDIQKSDDR
ncbi:hypothetical protein B11595_09140 [Campylobacter jejuni]|nr:hypothetical protein B11595_09140 [Campylobacter jejuni]